MLFAEYRNHRIISLHRDIGEPINCFYDPQGLPNKVIHHPIAADFFPGKEDFPSDLAVKMRLVAPEGGGKLEAYLTEKLGLTKGADFERHAKGERGGLVYFDIVTDDAIGKLFARADAIGQTSAMARAQRGTPPADKSR